MVDGPTGGQLQVVRSRPEFRRKIKVGHIADWPHAADTPDVVAARVRYEGNAEHKTYHSPAGPPALHADKAKCDEFARADWPRLQEALRRAIESECVAHFRGDFPSRAWVWINDVLHEARLTSEEQGTYHGFPIDDPRQYPGPEHALERAPHVTIPVIRH